MQDVFRDRLNIMTQNLSQAKIALSTTNDEQAISKVNAETQIATGFLLGLIAEELHAINKQLATMNGPKF